MLNRYRPLTVIFVFLPLLILAGCSGFVTQVQAMLITPTLLPTVTPIPTATLPSSAPTLQVIPTYSAGPSPTPRPIADIPVQKLVLPEPAATQVPVILGLTGFSKNINPLTGLEPENLENLERRPALIKVSNYPRYGRPHAGLSAADLVFEYYIGEGDNRFLALFYGQNSDKVGPLRSGRLIDAQLVNMYQGILAYGNADPKVDKVLVDELGQRAISFDNAGCPPICGSETHSVAGVFVDSGLLTNFSFGEGVDNSRPNLDGMLFDDNVPFSNKFAIDLGVQYSLHNRGEWHYDPVTGKYLRTIETDKNGTPENRFPQIPLVDRNTGEQLAFSNVIIVYAEYVEFAPTLHQVLVWDVREKQRALFFRDGVMIDGYWRATDHYHPMHFYNNWGTPMALKPGNTWIIFADPLSNFWQANDGQWELYFDLPHPTPTPEVIE